MSSLHKKTSEQERLLRETHEKQRVSESEVEELRRELRDVESVFGSQSAEMNSLNELLTEVGREEGFLTWEGK